MTTKRRILVVEDDALVATTVIRVLTKAGFDCRWSRTESDATRQALSWLPEVALIDRHLQDGDGLSLSRFLKATDPRPRLVMMSGDPVDDAESGDFDAWLLKPASIETLLASLEIDPSSGHM